MKTSALNRTIGVAVLTFTVLAVALLGASTVLANDACGVPESDTAPAFVGDPVTRVLELSQSSAQLASAFNVASYSAELIAPERLPELGRGRDLVGCGIETSGMDPSGTPVVLFRRGQLICFQLESGFSQYAIFHFDPTPTINRWVKLGTVVDLVENEACTSPTFRLPGLFALFGVPRGSEFRSSP